MNSFLVLTRYPSILKTLSSCQTDMLTMQDCYWAHFFFNLVSITKLLCCKYCCRFCTPCGEVEQTDVSYHFDKGLTSETSVYSTSPQGVQIYNDIYNCFLRNTDTDAVHTRYSTSLHLITKYGFGCKQRLFKEKKFDSIVLPSAIL